MAADRARTSSARLSAYAIAALAFAGHLAFGANRTNLALGLSALWFLALALLLTTQSWAARALGAIRLRTVALAFGLLIGLIGLQLTPFGPGGPHPVWSFVPGATPVLSIEPYATQVELVKLLALAATFLVGALFGADDARAKTLIRAILTVGLVFSAWAFVDHILNPAVLYGGPRPFDPTRLSAAFGSANTAATLFGALTLLNFTDLVRRYQANLRGGHFYVREALSRAPSLARPFLGLALAATCLILTYSRSGLIATAGVAVVLIGAMAMWRSRSTGVSAPLTATLLILAGLLVASLALNIDALGRRFSFFGQDSLARGQIFAAHWTAFQSAPWSGFGLGTFARINGLIMNQANMDVLELIGATHNLYIQWLEEGGIPGAAALLVVAAVIAVQLVIAAGRRRRMRSWILSLIAVLGVFALHGASDFALQTPSMSLFLSLLLGIGYGVGAPDPVAAAPDAGVRRAAALASRAETDAHVIPARR